MINNNQRNILAWIITILLALEFVLLAVSKILDQGVELYKSWGFSNWILYAIGIIELLAAIGLFSKKFGKVSVFIMIFFSIGNAFVHLVHGESQGMIMNAVIILFASTLWYLKKKDAGPLL